MRNTYLILVSIACLLACSRRGLELRPLSDASNTGAIGGAVDEASSGGAAGEVGAEATGGQGTGGILGTGGFGADGGDDALVPEVPCPPCIADIINSCLPAGKCVSMAGGSGQGWSAHECYDNGVRRSVGQTYNDRGFWSSGQTVYQGERVCYSETWRGAVDSDTGNFTFTDGNGNTLAQGKLVARGVWTIDCAGTTFPLSPTCGPEVERGPCERGDCRIP